MQHLQPKTTNPQALFALRQDLNDSLDGGLTVRRERLVAEAMGEYSILAITLPCSYKRSQDKLLAKCFVASAAEEIGYAREVVALTLFFVGDLFSRVSYIY